MGRGERAVGPGDRPPARGLRGLGEAADPLDGRADVRLAVPVSSAEPGPGEEYFVLGVVHQAGHDPTDAPSAPARRNRPRVLLPQVGLTPLMGQTLSEGLREVKIASTYDWEHLFPWGSHPQLDPLWS